MAKKKAKEQAPEPVGKEDLQATAAALKGEGVSVKGLDGGIEETPPKEQDGAQETAAPETQSAAQAHELEQTNAARAAFKETKAKRIQETLKVMAKQGVHYDESYMSSLPAIRDAKDEVALSEALMNSMATLVKRHKDVVVVGGEKEDFIMAGGTPLKAKSARDEWKCPNCGAINSMQYLHNEAQTHEVCPMCVVVQRRDVAHNLLRVIKDGKTQQEIDNPGKTLSEIWQGE